MPTGKSALRWQRWRADFYTAGETPALPVTPQWMFWEMLCEHLQCRLESRRAHNADLEVGAPMSALPGGAPRLVVDHVAAGE